MADGFSRRSVLAGAAVGAAATLTGCSERKLITSVAALSNGNAQLFRYPPAHPAFIIKLGQPAEGGVGPDADIVSFHTACPHMGCPLAVTDTTALLAGRLGPCTCHQSTFDLRFSGRQIYGRATQNLVRVLLESDGVNIFAVGVEGLPFGEPLKS